MVSCYCLSLCINETLTEKVTDLHSNYDEYGKYLFLVCNLVPLSDWMCLGALFWRNAEGNYVRFCGMYKVYRISYN